MSEEEREISHIADALGIGCMRRARAKAGICARAGMSGTLFLEDSHIVAFCYHRHEYLLVQGALYAHPFYFSNFSFK